MSKLAYRDYTITIISWLTITSGFGIIVLGASGGHGPQLFILLMAPILAVTGIICQLVTLRKSKTYSIKPFVAWLVINISTVFFYLAIFLFSLSFAGPDNGLDWNDISWWAMFALAFSVIPVLASSTYSTYALYRKNGSQTE